MTSLSRGAMLGDGGTTDNRGGGWGFMSDDIFEISGTTWLWKSATKPQAAGWMFLTIKGQDAAEIRFAAMGRSGGFGSIRVTAIIGGTRWQTSLFPQRETGGLLLPLKAAVRKAEGIGPDETRAVTIMF